MTLQNPWPIVGFVPDYGIGVTVTQRNLTTGEEESVISESDGSFLLDPINLPSSADEELGDIIRITAPELGYYAEVIVNVELYPDGVEVVLTNNPITMAAVIPSGVMAKFPHMSDRVMAFPGNVSVGRGGLG